MKNDESSNKEVRSQHSETSCCAPKKRFDYLLWGSLAVIVVSYCLHMLAAQSLSQWEALSHFHSSVFELMNRMWWGILLGVLMVMLISYIPREFIAYLMRGRAGVARAAFAGIVLDLCNHGILMVAAKLYERGATAGQMVAFLIASPWNSLSMTLILIALIGWSWTLVFIVASFVIAIITGWIFDWLVKVGYLPENPNKIELPEDFDFLQEMGAVLRRFRQAGVSRHAARDILLSSIDDSRMVLRWILFGIILASLIRVFISPESLGHWFGPTLAGLGLTILAATIIEVCSEGSAPIAADLLTYAKAPGNSLAFLMAGAATDYTEIMVVRERTRSWRIALCIPLVSVPQIILIAYLMNLWSSG